MGNRTATCSGRRTRSRGKRRCTASASPRSSPSRCSVHRRSSRWCTAAALWQHTVVGTYDRISLELRPSGARCAGAACELLETDSFITMPVYFGHRPIGRLYVTSRRFRYMEPDLRFLQQVIGQAALVVENIQLLDRLAPRSPPTSGDGSRAISTTGRSSRTSVSSLVSKPCGAGSGRHLPCRGSRRPCQDGGRGHRRAAPLRRRPA